jgi:uncharacterized protein (TIGR03118 family)
VYDPTGAFKLAVTIPGATAAATGSPTGQVYNSSSSFMGDKFIFDSEDGLITGWQSGATAVVRADGSAAQAIYKGLALVNDDGPLSLWAANFHAGTIDVFDENYAAVDRAGRFADPALPAGLAPFNIEAAFPNVYVAYAVQDANAEDDVGGPGLGQIDVFDTKGAFVKTLVSGGALNSPWGLARVPDGFGPFSGALLVGNFGDGTVHAYDRVTGKWLGQLADASGKALVIDGLWAIEFGPTVQGQSPTLYFTAGPAGETHGVFGKLEISE